MHIPLVRTSKLPPPEHVHIFHNFYSEIIFIFFSWGGCIVAICDSLESSTKYMNELKEKYFKHLTDYNENDADNVVFVTNPQSGASIFLTS